MRRCRRSLSQSEQSAFKRGGNLRQSVPHNSVRFDTRNAGSGNRSNSTSQEVLAHPAPPMRYASSVPALLNYVGREELASEVVYRGSERSRSHTTSQVESESDIFTCTCGQRISRGQITSHMSEECPRRLTKCQYCRTQVKFEDMQVCTAVERL